MKYKIFILLFFLNSCVANQSVSNLKLKKGDYYSSKGFALIYQEKNFEDKLVSKKLDNEKLQIAHTNFGRNKVLVLTNPNNNKSIELPVTKKAKYPGFFNLLITKKVSEKLELDEQFPLLEINVRTKNRSFVAKKTVMHSEEKNVHDKAPVTKIKIDNISKNKINNKTKIQKKKKFYIIIGEFYSSKSALNLRDMLAEKYIKKDLLKLKKLAKTRYELSAGPYFTINTLKNGYFALNKYGFDNLDIKQND